MKRFALVLMVGAAGCTPQGTDTPRRFDATLDYAGVRYEGTLTFPGKEGSATLDSGDLPIASAQAIATAAGTHAFPTTQESYQLDLIRDAADAAAYADANEPYAVCLVYDVNLGDPVPCAETIENASVTLRETP